MATMFWIWMAAAVVFLIVELLTPTMIFICFAVGAACAGIYAQVGPEGSINWQVGLFAVVSVALLPLTRKFAKRMTKESAELSNVDRMIGKVALVTKDIDPDLGGRVQFEGETWAATATETIPSGARVKILSVSGTRVNVERFVS
ncbi:MAG: NfeD family protein [candidate division Zixibacteria bacterium]|nr:NfeD family protein [candidate division Zixibacteria bacterium]